VFDASSAAISSGGESSGITSTALKNAFSKRSASTSAAMSLSQIMSSVRNFMLMICAAFSARSARISAIASTLSGNAAETTVLGMTVFP
jgi:hypothetical protein